MSETRGGINATTVAGIAGAVLGAGITAGAVALSDKKTRDMMAEKITHMKKQAVDMMAKGEKKADEVSEKAKKIIEEGKMAVEGIKEPIKE